MVKIAGLSLSLKSRIVEDVWFQVLSFGIAQIYSSEKIIAEFLDCILKSITHAHSQQDGQISEIWSPLNWPDEFTCFA